MTKFRKRKLKKQLKKHYPHRVDFSLRELKKLEEEIVGDITELKDRKKISNNIISLMSLIAEQTKLGMNLIDSLDIVDKLSRGFPLSELTGEESEWSEPFGTNNRFQVNKRCSAVIRRDFSNSTATYIYGKAFSKDGGNNWYFNEDSFEYIDFPFSPPVEPELVYIDNNEDTLD